MTIRRLLLCGLLLVAAVAAEDYFPPPDRDGGWRTLADSAQMRRVAGVDKAKLDQAFDYIQKTTKHGGLLVARRGWLVYERYFGRAHRDANPNNASVGKSYTSIATGILMHERLELFPEGLDQKIFTPIYFPPEVFPLSDPRKADIKLGQLLAMTAGIRGNNPGLVKGKEVTLDPEGPDGWIAVVDKMATGKMEGERNAITMWCEPGGGYSYATSSIHLVSMMIRHLSGMELEQYVDQKLAQPMGWGRWGWGYKHMVPDHTSGGGGIAPRPTDMLRFAYLLLRQGRWKDLQLVPADYLRQAGQPSPYNPHFDYSLQFNVNGRVYWDDVPRDTFWKTGSGGFCIYLIPSLDLVIYKMGGRDGQYAPENTQMEPAPESVFRYDGSRDGWKPEASGDPYHQTLQLVLDSLTDRESASVWPVPQWVKAPGTLNRYVNWLESKASGKPFGTVVVQNGMIICEHYGGGANQSSRWEIGSIRKSVASGLMGMAIAEGKLTLDTPTHAVWPEIVSLPDAAKDKRIVMRHLMAMISGWKTPRGPGEEWFYNNAACTAGGAVIGRAYGMKDDRIAPLVMERIAKPIGALGWRSYHYSRDFSASYGNPGPKLAIDSNMRDLARYGYLWLREGRWVNQQLIPSDYVRDARTNQTAAEGGHYGYWWFTNDSSVLLPDAPADTFYHVGNGKDNRRTVLAIIPSIDLVAAVGVSAEVFDITRDYKARPVTAVNEWIGTILEAIGSRVATGGKK